MLDKRNLIIALVVLFLLTSAMIVIASPYTVFTIHAEGNNTYSGTIKLRCNSAPNTSCQVSGDWAAMNQGCAIICPDSDVRVDCEVGPAQASSRELDTLRISGQPSIPLSGTRYARDFVTSTDTDFTCVYTD